MAHAVAASFEPRFGETDARFVVDTEPAPVIGDRDRLERLASRRSPGVDTGETAVLYGEGV